MTLQKQKAKKFGEALEEFERFKVQWEAEHPNASEDEYLEAISAKAEELDL